MNFPTSATSILGLDRNLSNEQDVMEEEETSPPRFESLEKLCDHTSKNNWYYIKTECDCCDPYDTTIYKRSGCKSCVMESYENLVCGGHFRSCILYKNNKKLKIHGDLETDGERYQNLITEMIEDLDTKQLKKVLKFIYDV